MNENHVERIKKDWRKVMCLEALSLTMLAVLYFKQCVFNFLKSGVSHNRMLTNISCIIANFLLDDMYRKTSIPKHSP